MNLLQLEVRGPEMRARMYLRRLCGALSHEDVRDLVDAEHFAEKRGRRLNTTITVHPKLLTSYPADVVKWVSSFLNKLRIWCVRDRRFGYFALWVRESYEGDRREHLHVLVSVPDRDRSALEAALRRWLPGADGVFDLGRPEYRRDRFGRVTNKAMTYVLKQMTTQAWWSLEKQVRRETHCRETHLPVAPVLGKRCGVSRSLNKATRQAFWERRSSPARQVGQRRLSPPIKEGRDFSTEQGVA